MEFRMMEQEFIVEAIRKDLCYMCKKSDPEQVKSHEEPYDDYTWYHKSDPGVINPDLIPCRAQSTSDLYETLRVDY